MAIFWALLLAHLLGDFVLQSDRLVQAKHRLSGLLIHGAIHLAVGAALLLPEAIGAWVVLALLIGSHMLVDSLKISRERAQQRSQLGLFLADQFVHLLLIAGAARWLVIQYPSVHPWLSEKLIVAAVGLTLVTFVWWITEQILVEGRADRAYVRELSEYRWGRMAARSIAFLGIWLLIGGTGVAMQALPIPYVSGRYRLRAFLTDSTVVVLVALILRLAA